MRGGRAPKRPNKRTLQNPRPSSGRLRASRSATERACRGTERSATQLAHHAQTRVGPSGAWRIALPRMAKSVSDASTLYFESSDGGHESLSDVLFGDVFLCSGQSNMVIGLKNGRYPIFNSSAVLASADAVAHLPRSARDAPHEWNRERDAESNGEWNGERDEKWNGEWDVERGGSGHAG